MAEQHTRITVLISGSGTNLQALIDACKAGKFGNASIVRVISNKKAAYGLERAKAAGIPTGYHNLLKYKIDYPDGVSQEQDRSRGKYDRKAFDRDLASLVLADNPHLVVCAGYMLVLNPDFLDPVKAAGVDIINLHPALSGEYNGIDAIKRAHNDFMNGTIRTTDAGVPRTGVMIHYVIHEVDMGQPLLTKEIELHHPEDDDLAALEQRIHRTEWIAIVEGTQIAIKKLWEKRGSSAP